nr:retrovirus-related Pol polyprotein from transposon TNT 1-94 [Tanacetum cinerariifolium]
MYKIHTDHNQTKTSQPQLKSNPQGDRVLCNSSQRKKQDVEDQRRNVRLSKNKTSVTACNDNLNAKTLNVKSVFAMCDKCVLIDKHDMCVLNSVAKPIKRTIASESNQKPRNFTRKLYEHFVEIVLFIVDSGCSKHMTGNLKLQINFVEKFLGTFVEIVLFIVDSGCSKHMKGNLKLLINFVEKFLGTVKFRNDQIAPIFGYGDVVQGALKFVKDHLYSSCELGKPSESLFTLNLPQAQKDGYNFYTWTYVVPCGLVQRGLQAQVRVVRTDKGTEFLNQTLHAYFAAEGIHHQTSVARTPEQNGIVER